MRARYLIIGVVISLAGCAVRPNSPAPASLPHSSSTAMTQTDPELDQAIDKAKKTLDSFITRLQHPTRGEVFSVRAYFPASDGSKEPLWMDVDDFKNGAFDGTITSKPSKASSVGFRTPTQAKRADVIDWMILKSGQQEGAYTVDVLMRRQAAPK